MKEEQEKLIYGLDDRVPFRDLLLMGLQHVFVMSSTLVLPVVLVRNIGGSMETIQSVLCFTMIAAGLGTIIQSLRFGVIGSGYLVPNLCGPSYFGVSIHAAWIGGLPLMHGMTLIGGIFEALFSRIIHKIRFFFPASVTGLVVLVVGISLVPLGASKFLGVEIAGDPIEPVNLAVAIITLGSMVGVNVWSRKKLKLYSVLIGLFAGYVASFVLGVLTADDLHRITDCAWFLFPWEYEVSFGIAFSWDLVLPFCIVSLCGSLKSFGNIITAQKINDPNWKEPEMKSISSGLLADSVSVMTAGLLGGMATDTSASNVGLSAATKATARRIAWSCGGLFILLAFFPRLAILFYIMPAPVMGAILIFVTCFMLISGIQIIMTKKLDAAQIFIIGISLVFGLSADIIPDMYAGAPFWLRPLFASSLTFSTFMAIFLNQVLSLGRKKATLKRQP